MSSKLVGSLVLVVLTGTLGVMGYRSYLEEHPCDLVQIRCRSVSAGNMREAMVCAMFGMATIAKNPTNEGCRKALDMMDHGAPNE